MEHSGAGLRLAVSDQHGGHRYDAGTHRGGLADVRADGVCTAGCVRADGGRTVVNPPGAGEVTSGARRLLRPDKTIRDDIGKCILLAMTYLL